MTCLVGAALSIENAGIQDQLLLLKDKNSARVKKNAEERIFPVP